MILGFIILFSIALILSVGLACFSWGWNKGFDYGWDEGRKQGKYEAGG